MRTIDADNLSERKFIFAGTSDSYAKGWNDAIDAIMENEPSVPSELAQHVAFICGQESVKRQYGVWIPVSERLPEEDVNVIVTDVETICTYLAYYAGDGIWDCDNGPAPNRIIAWMPLPEPYKEADDESGRIQK